MTDHHTDVRYTVEPRLIPPKKAARRLHLTYNGFIAALPALRREGFPAACNVTGHYDLKAIDAWLDMRSGLASGALREAEVDRLFAQAMEAIQ